MNNHGQKTTSENVEWAAVRSDVSGDGPFFTIGELSQEFGLTLRALRFYEDKGLVSPQRRGVTRLYSQRDRERLSLIVKGKKLGFTLGEIRELISATERGSEVSSLNLSREKCLEQINLLEKQRNEIDSALMELKRLYASLSAKNLGGETNS